jgi:hypothetical protein
VSVGVDTLSPADLQLHEALGIPPQLLAEAGVRRVTNQEARRDCGIRYKSDHLEGSLVDLVLEAGAELWHTPSGDPHITIGLNGHREHHRLGSRSSRTYLARLFTRTRREPRTRLRCRTQSGLCRARPRMTVPNAAHAFANTAVEQSARG